MVALPLLVSSLAACCAALPLTRLAPAFAQRLALIVAALLLATLSRRGRLAPVWVPCTRVGALRPLSLAKLLALAALRPRK